MKTTPTMTEEQKLLADAQNYPRTSPARQRQQIARHEAAWAESHRIAAMQEEMWKRAMGEAQS